MKARWQRLRPQVLRRIKPTAAQTRKAREAATRLSALAKKEAKRQGVVVRPMVVGSLAKDTHLRPKPDIDLFLLFPTSVKREDLERIGTRIGKRVLRAARLRYAEHPYVRGRFGPFEFDVVPAYAVSTGAGKMSAVDRSPFHAEYVRRHLRRSQADEVRILKQFLKGIGCYGAETATAGFSGYMAELLVLRFGDFWRTLQELGPRSAPIRLALEGEAPPLGGDLVFVDPVDPARNAAAAVGRNRLETFLRAARAFTAAPSLGFFWPRPRAPVPLVELRAALAGRGIVAVDVPSVTVREEARIPHVRRFAEKVSGALAEEGFQILRSDVVAVSGKRMLALWEHQPAQLAEDFVHVGPPVGSAAHSRRFLEKWQTSPEALELPHPVDGRWQVRVRRRERTAVHVLLKRWPELLKGLDVAPGVKAKLQPRAGEEVLRVPALRQPLAGFLLPQDPWGRA